MKSGGLGKSKMLRLKIACQMTKMVSFSVCGPHTSPFSTPHSPPMAIGHFSMSRPIKYFHYIYVFCTLSFFRLLISAAIRLGLTFCGQEGKGGKKEAKSGKDKSCGARRN